MVAVVANLPRIDNHRTDEKRHESDTRPPAKAREALRVFGDDASDLHAEPGS
jgi:hypothetical protein